MSKIQSTMGRYSKTYIDLTATDTIVFFSLISDVSFPESIVTSYRSCQPKFCRYLEEWICKSQGGSWVFITESYNWNKKHFYQMGGLVFTRRSSLLNVTLQQQKNPSCWKKPRIAVLSVTGVWRFLRYKVKENLHYDLFEQFFFKCQRRKFIPVNLRILQMDK